MDDMPAEERAYPPPPSKLSKTPSWIMLGFLLGATFVWMLPHEEKSAVPPTLAPAKPRVASEPARTALSRLTIIEAVFEAYGRYAVWDNDTTEVALDAGSGTFTEFYEVKRSGDTYYYRSIPKLTRRIIRHGKVIPGSPLQFTETEEQYRDWQENGRTERPPEPGGIETASTRPSPSRPQISIAAAPVPRLEPVKPSIFLTPGAGR